MRDALAAQLSDRYTIDRELGRGGMASVWLAHDLRYDRAVAIKVLHPELAAAIGVDRFVREIRLTARLQHPNIVPVLDSGTFTPPGGPTLPWYAMAYVAGESLRARLEREGQLPVEEAIRITSEAADALAAAHREGVVHRDIKPENLLLSGGRVWVADFGIAKALVEVGGDRLTSTGFIVGTPAYMSPEQATGDRVDARSDQYSLATVLYELLAGEPPYTGASAQMIIARRMSEPPRALHPVRPSIPDEMEAAIRRALERLPADRFPGMLEFVAALRPGAVRAAPRRARSHTLRAAGGAALFALVALGGWLVTKRDPAVAERRDPQVVALRERGRQAFSRRTPVGAREAIDLYSAAIRIDSTWAPLWAGLAEAYVQAYGRGFVFPGAVRDSAIRLAVAAADRALLLDPQSADAWVARGAVSRQMDPTDLGPPIATFRRALAIDSAHPRAWFLLGVMTSDNGDLTGGLEAFRRSVALDPSNPEALSFLALGHYWRRQYDSAAAWADSAVAVNPTFLLAKTTLGQIAVERGQHARARAAFDAARRVTTDVEALNTTAGMALIEAKRGNREEAARLLDQAESLAVEYVPIPPHTGVYLAHAYAVSGDATAAIDWLTRVSPRDDLHFQLHLRCDPPFDAIAEDPRFRALLVAPRPRTGC
ncbi:MAG TPA: protein kinase [Gemmatimonadales bacterium]|nr:protein kinase [Gemmatimonadales bacterium]